jgi:hypothetical protein
LLNLIGGSIRFQQNRLGSEGVGNPFAMLPSIMGKKV